jgi:hypothetical protein
VGLNLKFKNSKPTNTTNMKSDAYTKVILTVIAICLLCLVSKTFNSVSLVPSANAQGFPSQIDVNINQIGGLPVVAYIPVKIDEVGNGVRFPQ